MNKAENKTKTPKLRFPEFKGEWEEYCLGKLCETFKSGNGITSERIKETGKYPVYGGNGLRGFTDAFTHDGYYVLIGRQGALCGNINRTFGKSYISEHAIAVRTNENSDTEWLAQKLDYLQLNRLSESSAQPGLAVNKLVKLKLKVPTLPEQKKIASFLSAVDKKIQQLTRKKELLEKYKKGVMQKIFSQQIRFKDENGNNYPDWVEKKLGEVGDIVGGGTPDSNIDEYWNGGIQWFTPTKMKSKYVCSSKRTISDSGLKNSSAKLLPINSILITTRATIGDVSIALCECSTNQGFQSIIVNELNNIEFLYYLINSIKKELLRKASGSTFLEIGKKELQKIKVFFPSFPEQQKIAAFLSGIDRKIESVALQLKETKAFKKGLLQQMFV